MEIQQNTINATTSKPHTCTSTAGEYREEQSSGSILSWKLDHLTNAVGLQQFADARTPARSIDTSQTIYGKSYSV